MPHVLKVFLALAVSLASVPALAAPKSKKVAPAPAPVSVKSEPVVAVAPEPPPAPVKSEPKKTSPSTTSTYASDLATAPKRVGIMLDLFLEGGHLGAEQWINNTRRDESFDYGYGVASATAYVLFQQTERLRVGPAIRFFGNYGALGNNAYQMGILTEALVLGEFSLPAFEKFDLVLGGRAGLSALFPNGEFAEEISRLQQQGAGVWSVPRFGWTVGANAGLRRPIAGNLHLRTDLNLGYGHMYLFHTDEVVQELRFRKFWGIDQLRFGLTLGAEVAF